MNTHSSNLARRDFIRLCAAAIACPAVGGPPLEDIVVGIDIGTAQVCVAVGERYSHGAVKILGIGHALSRGVTRHGIMDFEAATACVEEALVDAEMKSNVMIRSVVLAVAGRLITPCDSGPTWESIFEWEKSCYITRSDGVLRRINLADGKRLKDYQIVAGAGVRIENSIRCLKALGVQVERLVLAPSGLGCFKPPLRIMPVS